MQTASEPANMVARLSLAYPVICLLVVIAQQNLGPLGEPSRELAFGFRDEAGGDGPHWQFRLTAATMPAVERQEPKQMPPYGSFDLDDLDLSNVEAKPIGLGHFYWFRRFSRRTVDPHSDN